MTDKESLKEFDFVKFAQQKVNEAITNGTDSLVLEGFGLDELPQNIEYINSKSLFLGQNKIGCIPDKIFSLKSLMLLRMRGNQIHECPADISKLRNLHILLLDENELTQVPSELGELSQLRILHLNNNKLRKIPSSLDNLTKLKYLDLSHNQLDKLPNSIENLTDLHYLICSHNKLTQLPEEICQFTKLKHLDLSHNQLTEIPQQFIELKNLDYLDLRGNSLLDIPDELISNPKNAQELLRYLSHKERIPLNELKLILVGEANVGKSAIIQQLTEGIFRHERIITEGIDIKTWQVTPTPALPQREREQDSHLLVGEGLGVGYPPLSEGERLGVRAISVNMWDFGGQQIMHATHQFFMTNRTLYILVLDVTQDMNKNRVTYWQNMIESFGKDSPIIVVVNKMDETSHVLDLTGFENLSGLHLVKTSCKTGEGVEALKQTIMQTIESMSHVRDLIPRPWLDIKNDLVNMQKNTITHAEFIQHCHDKGISETDEQATLLKLLHDLGSVLHFHDDPALRDTVVINPHWVTNGIYKIINAKNLKANSGILKIDNLQNILPAADYPPKTHYLIINMMKRFERCFEIEGNSNKEFFIPDLFPEAESIPAHWDEKGIVYDSSLKSYYRYNFLPQSVMGQLMFQFHAAMSDTFYWRHGMVLHQGKTESLIKANTIDNIITVLVFGNNDEKYKIAGKIRYVLKKIHAKITNLHVDEGLNYEGETIWHWQVKAWKIKGLHYPPYWHGDNPPRIYDLLYMFEKLLMDTSEEDPHIQQMRQLKETFPPDIALSTVMGCANGYYQSEQFQMARQVIAIAHELVRDLRRMNLSDAMQQILSANNEDVYQKLVHACLETERIKTAFEHAATAKGQAFINQLAKSRFDFSHIDDKVFHADLATFRQLQKTRLQTHDLAERFAHQQDELKAWTKLEQRYPMLTALFSVPQIDMETTQTLANELDATLVEFYRHADGWCAFVIQPMPSPQPSPTGRGSHDSPLLAGEGLGVGFVELPHLTDTVINDVKTWIKRVENPMGTGRNKHFLKPLDTLYQAAIKPIYPYLSTDLVILAPHAELHKLPLAAARDMSSPRERRELEEGGTYFAEQKTLMVVPSLTVLHVLHEQNEKDKKGSGKHFLSETELLCIAHAGEGDSYLENVANEAKAIAQSFQPSTLITNDKNMEVTPEVVMSHAPQKRLIHISSHGKFNKKEPEKSGLLLANDSILTVQDIISRMTLHADMVTLAACESGQVDVQKGDELVGLLQALMTAGAKSVVASLWRVDDAATSHLFQRFYEEIGESSSPAIAMQNTSQMLQKEYPNPYYWAAFQTYGLGHQGINIQLNPNPQKTILGIIASNKNRSIDMHISSLYESATMLACLLQDKETYSYQTLQPEQKQSVKEGVKKLHEDNPNDLKQFALDLHDFVLERDYLYKALDINVKLWNRTDMATAQRWDDDDEADENDIAVIEAAQKAFVGLINSMEEDSIDDVNVDPAKTKKNKSSQNA